MAIMKVKLINGEQQFIRYRTLRAARLAAMILNRPGNAIVYAWAYRSVL
jgi:hypothetical protein